MYFFLIKSSPQKKCIGFRFLCVIFRRTSNEIQVLFYLVCLKDTDTLKLVMDQIHQPVTLFLPTDATMSALAQEQKDFLYAMHNRDQLAEYLRYHIVRDTKVGLYSVCWFFWKEHGCINDDRKFSVNSPNTLFKCIAFYCVH